MNREGARKIGGVGGTGYDVGFAIYDREGGMGRDGGMVYTGKAKEESKGMGHPGQGASQR